MPSYSKQIATALCNKKATLVFPGGSLNRFINYSSTDKDPFPLASEGPRPHATTIKREAIWLYRDVLRAARLFTWADKDGILWKYKLIACARKEFEASKYEKDPEELGRLLVTGRDALMQMTDRMVSKARKLVEDEKKIENPRAIPLHQDVSSPWNTTWQPDSDAWKKNWQRRHQSWEKANHGK